MTYTQQPLARSRRAHNKNQKKIGAHFYQKSARVITFALLFGTMLASIGFFAYGKYDQLQAFIAIPPTRVLDVDPTPLKATESTKETEYEQMMAYIVKLFKNDADEMITIIRACENGTFDPKRVSGLNIQKSGRRSYDVGLAQINVDELDTKEIEKLKDWKYNLDRAYEKYTGAGKTFRPWTCAHVVGQKNYLQ